MRFVFFGTPEFAVKTLEKLNELGDISLVVTQLDKKKGRGKKLLPPPVKIRAEELGLEIYQVNNINDSISIEKLKAQDADIFVVAAFGQILSEEVLNIPKYCVNVHASLLPKYRGAAPINRVILNGEEKTGITIMKMEKGLDTGDMAIKKEIAIGDLDAGELEEKLAYLGAEAIEEFIENYKKNELKFTPQDDSKSTYAQKLNKETFNIDFKTQKTAEILNMIRASSPHFGAKTKYKGEMFKIFKAREVNSNRDYEAGVIINSSDKIIVKTLDKAIELLEIQIPNKKRMKVQDFLRGNSIEENIKLGD